MKWVNRMAVVVRRKEPDIAWARSLEPDPPIDYLKGRANAFTWWTRKKARIETRSWGAAGRRFSQSN